MIHYLAYVPFIVGGALAVWSLRRSWRDFCDRMDRDNWHHHS